MKSERPSFTSEQILEILSLSDNATAIYSGKDIVIQAANDAMISFWGKDRSVIGKPLEVAVPELSGQPFLEILANVWNTGVTFESKDAAADLLIDGKLKTFFFDFTYRAIKDEQGQMHCILHTATDVSEINLHKKMLVTALKHKQSLDEEQALNEILNAANEDLNSLIRERNRELLASEAKFRSLIEDSPIAMQVFRGEEMTFEIVNDAMLKFLGKTKAIIGLPLFVGVPEIVGQPIVALLYQVYRSGDPMEIKSIEVFLDHNGTSEVGYYDVSYRPLYENEVITGVLGIAIDVTAQVTIQNEINATNALLMESEEKLTLAIQTGKMGTWSIAMDTMEINVSDFVRDLLGLPVNEVPSMELIMEAIDEEFHPILSNVLKNAVEKGMSSDIEYSIHNLITKELKWVRVTGRVFSAIGNSSAQYTGMFIDITEQKKDEQRKNDFIGMVSHELKTPLTSLTGYLQLLQARAKKTDDSFVGSALEKANKQIKSMTTMINGFLNVSRLESAKLHIDLQVFDMADLVKEMEEEVTVTINSHRFLFAPVMNTLIEADRDKIGQVINNFISNAVKYAPSGSLITVSCISIDGGVQVSVRDEGMGIEAHNLDKLFDRYYRVEGRHTNTISGFGIGLYLCDEILQRHNGKIWVESVLGQGSIFHFSLPSVG